MKKKGINDWRGRKRNEWLWTVANRSVKVDIAKQFEEEEEKKEKVIECM